MNKPDTTGAFAEFIAGLRFDDLPADVVEHAGWLVLDGIANIIAGSATDIARRQLDLFAGWGGNPQATVLGTGTRLTVPMAAYLNAAQANLLDFDDTYKTFIHPGATSIAPALAIAEERRLSGRQLIEAVVAGYETQIRVMEAGLPTPRRRRQIWGFAVWQTLGSAAAAARACALDATAVRHALSLGAFNAPVPNIPKLGLGDERPGAWTKNNYGWAAQGGVTGVLFAERGFRGNKAILDGQSGFWAMAGSDRFDAAAAVAGLGDQYRFTQTSFKPYACCRWAHSTLDAVRALTAQLRPGEDIRDVEVHAFGDLVSNLSWATPEDLVDAQFSLPFLVALELAGRSCSRGLDEASISDPEIIRRAERVRLVHDPSVDEAFYQGHLPARVIAATDQERQIECVKHDAWGTPGQPFSRQDCWRKFLALTAPILGHGQAADLGHTLLDLATVPDVAGIVGLMADPRGLTPGKPRVTI